MTGVNIRAVQQLLGHSDVRTSMRYAHLSDDYLEEAVNTLSARMNVKKTSKSGDRVKGQVSKNVDIYEMPL